MKSFFIYTIFSFVIVGCAATPNYSKPGSTTDDLNAAIVDCNNQLATRGPASRRMSGVGAPGSMATGPVTRAGTLEHKKNLDLCLKAKGWTPEKNRHP